MSFAGFLRGLSFNLLGADAAPAADGRFHLGRPDGSTVTLLDSGPFALERGNTRLPVGDSRRDTGFRALCEMPKMSTFAIGGIVNAAVADMSEGNAFVNVGVWHGYTFLAGLYGNADADALGIDDFSQFGGPRDEFARRFERMAGERHAFVEADYREVLAGGLDTPIGVYMYDGAHSYDDQLDGLRLAEPFFTDGCIVIVDDANWPPARRATLDFVAGSPREYSVLLDVPTPGKHPTLWNGLLVLREGGAETPSKIERVPAPHLRTVEPPAERLNETVAALIDARAPEAAVAATIDALRSQSHADVELHTFGSPAMIQPEVDHQESALGALLASDSAYALLLDAGVEPAPSAVEHALILAGKTRGPWASSPRRRRFREGNLDEYRQRQRDFRRRFAHSFGYEIRDPFAEVCAMLADGRPFSHSRFGDGELKAVFGAEGANCDGHRFFPELGQRLATILASKPDYMLGLLPLAVRVHGMERVLSISDGIHWVLANSFPLALLERRFDRFLDALDDRDVTLVGPEHLRPLSSARGWEHLVVASRDCWTEYDDVSALLRASVPTADGVVLFCASMMSNVLIDDLYAVAPANTCIDVGSAFDPLCGVSSRLYHDALDPAAPGGIAIAG
jgi:hypothetical protein